MYWAPRMRVLASCHSSINNLGSYSSTKESVLAYIDMLVRHTLKCVDIHAGSISRLLKLCICEREHGMWLISCLNCNKELDKEAADSAPLLLRSWNRHCIKEEAPTPQLQIKYAAVLASFLTLHKRASLFRALHVDRRRCCKNFHQVSILRDKKSLLHVHLEKIKLRQGLREASHQSPSLPCGPSCRRLTKW